MTELEGRIRLGVWWVDDVSDFASGFVDTTQPPYSGNSLEGQAVLSLHGNGVNTGIWVLGSHADPAAVPVVRRADAVSGERFWTGELIGHIYSGTGELTMYKFTVFDDNDATGILLSAEVNFDTIYPKASLLIP